MSAQDLVSGTLRKVLVDVWPGLSSEMGSIGFQLCSLVSKL